MNDLTVTLMGWVATEPKRHVGAQGTNLTVFRVASTSRYYDRKNGAWVDNPTEWFTVRIFRGGAITAKESLVKGQPVVVYGKLKTSEWEAQDGKRTDLVIDAFTVGHDLTRGVASFTRATGDESLDAADADQPEDQDMADANEGEVPVAGVENEGVVDADQEVALSA